MSTSRSPEIKPAEPTESTMRAITLESFEDAPGLREVPKPEIAADEVLVRVHASSVNGFDGAVATLMAKEYYEYEFPVTLGADLAGVIEQIGPEVSRYSVGDEVFGFIFRPSLHHGSWADYVSVPESWFIAPKPKSLGFLEAGALPLAGVSALLAVEAVSPSEGDRVLVVGATGGVGGYAVQLAAARGATVIATTRPDDEARLRELGAAETIDFTRHDVAAVRERYPDGVQGLIDLVNFADGFAAVAELVAPGGHAASTLGAANVEELSARNITAANIMTSPDPALLARLAQHADAGRLRVTIDSTFPLEEALDGLTAFGRGKRGKLAVSVVP
ncbi:MAG: NADP-dependent oxidoreductase [Gaiellaceae bacterium]